MLMRGDRLAQARSRSNRAAIVMKTLSGTQEPACPDGSAMENRYESIV
jgi:hypothetical protein